MALLPRALRPSVVIRRKALWTGVLGSSRLWQYVALWVFGKSMLKKFLGSQPERIAVHRIGANSFVNVVNVKPMTRKQQRTSGITRKMLEAQAATDVANSWARKVEAKPSRKNRRRAAKTEAMASTARAKAARANRPWRKKVS